MQHMNLAQFIEQTAADVVAGVKAARARVGENGQVKFAPQEIDGKRSLTQLEFDVAVVATIEGSASAGGSAGGQAEGLVKILVANVHGEVHGELSGSASRERTHRVRFTVPILFNTPT